MQKVIKTILLTAAVLTTAFVFTACQKEWEPSRNMVRIQKDKPVSQAIFFEKDSSKEEKEELLTLLKAGVKEYNQSYGKDLVMITKPKEENPKLEKLDYVILDYATMMDYGRFNEYSVYFGDASEAQKAGFSIADREFFKVEKGQAASANVVKAGEISLDGMRLLVLDPSIQPFQEEKEAQAEWNYFEVADGEVAYVTENIQLSEGNVLTVTPGSQVPGYVIYR